ncbi:MAG TPA: RNA methyltransferase [Candidatus Nanoarchaeia archaeon]|nr:RNA methyltransferase [Candidatus Nanoarchaeia archaeon]
MKIALHETITPGNIGAVSRVMKNFGFNELLLVSPKCDHLSDEAVKRATHGIDILQKAKVIREEELFSNFVIGTTSKAFTSKAHRQAVTPDQLSFAPSDAVILFGREDNGLSNDLLNKCDSLVTILTGTKYTSLNLSHSVAIVLYELRGKPVKKNLATIETKDSMLKFLYTLSDELKRDQSTKTYLKNVVNRALIYKNEGRAIMGLLSELLKKR